MEDKRLFEEAKKSWGKHFEIAYLEYPDENVIRFLSRHKSEGGNIVDLGCATGRHTEAAVKMGFQVTAVDFAKQCIDITKQRIEHLGLSNKVRYIQNNDIDISVEDASQDIVIAWGVLFSYKKDMVAAYIKEICRILKPNGYIFCDCRTQRDSFFSETNKNEDNMYKRMDGVYYYIPTLEEIKGIFIDAGLFVEKVELFEFTENNMEKLNSWYHITARKN